MDKAWKQYERRIARYFPNGRRRGPDVDGGKSDIVCDGWAPECQLSARGLSYGGLHEKVAQSERNALPGQTPVVIAKRKHQRDADSLVIFRLSTFEAVFLGDSARRVGLADDDDIERAAVGPALDAGLPEPEALGDDELAGQPGGEV